MVSFNSGFDATASIQGQTVRLSVSVQPANSSKVSMRFRDLPLTGLVGTHDERRAVLLESIKEMWGDIIANEVCDRALLATVAEFDHFGIAYKLV